MTHDAYDVAKRLAMRFDQPGFVMATEPRRVTVASVRRLSENDAFFLVITNDGRFRVTVTPDQPEVL